MSIIDILLMVGLVLGCAGILYVLGKILAMGARAMLDNDD